MIDHFLPWARHIDNAIENLVFAQRSCNIKKGAHLASAPHVERWIKRMTRPTIAAALRKLADQKRWESHSESTQAAARSIYLRLPDGYKLWRQNGRFTPVDRQRVRHALMTK